MALDLVMKITADASQAKAELQKVETGLQNIEKAAKRGEPSLADVAKQLGVNVTQTNTLTQSTSKLEQAAAQTTEQWLEQQYALNAVSKAQAIANAETKLAAEGQTALTAAVGTSTLAMQGLAAAFAAFLAVGALELKFLYDSARLYAEKSGMLKQFEGAVESVQKSWENMQYAVGASLLTNIHDVTSWATIAKMAVDEVGVYITHMVIQAQAALGILSSALRWVPGVGGGVTPPKAPNLITPNRSFSTGQITGRFSGNESAGSIEAELNSQRAALDKAAGRKTTPYVIPTAGGGIDIGGIPMGAFGLPTQLGGYAPAIPYLPFHAGIQGSIGAQMGLPQIPKGAGQGFFGSVFGGNFGSSLSNVILSAATGGGSFLQGAGSLVGGNLGSTIAKSLTTGLGAITGFAGGALNAVLPGVGSLLGPLLGKLGGLFGETQGHKDLISANSQIAGIKTDLLSQYGSAENIVALGGGDLTKGWGGQNVKGLQAFSGEVDKFKAHANDAMNDMIHAALTAGTAIPAGMRPILESLIRQGQLTQANTNLLLGMPEAGVPSFQQVSKAAEELGVNLDAIGKNIQNMKLGETAEAAAQAFQTLKDAGADMGAVFEQSAPKIQQIVNDALKMGLSLPESIKPWLQQMIDAGLLVDETGQKLSDLSKFSFTKPLEQSVDDLIKKLDELIDTIKTGLGGAIDSIDGKQVDVTVNRHVKDDPGSDAETGDNPPGYAHGTNGYEYFGSGKTVRLHGWEKVTPLSASRSERVAIPVTLQIDGRTIAELTARTYLSG